MFISWIVRSNHEPFSPLRFSRGVFWNVIPWDILFIWKGGNKKPKTKTRKTRNKKRSQKHNCAFSCFFGSTVVFHRKYNCAFHFRRSTSVLHANCEMLHVEAQLIKWVQKNQKRLKNSKMRAKKYSLRSLNIRSISFFSFQYEEYKRNVYPRVILFPWSPDDVTHILGLDPAAHLTQS